MKLTIAAQRDLEISKLMETAAKIGDKNISISSVVNRFNELKATVKQARLEMRALEKIIIGVTNLKEEELKNIAPKG